MHEWIYNDFYKFSKKTLQFKALVASESDEQHNFLLVLTSTYN